MQYIGQANVKMSRFMHFYRADKRNWTDDVRSQYASARAMNKTKLQEKKNERNFIRSNR